MSDLKSSELEYGERIGSGGSDAVLSSYFRDILLNLSIDSNRFQALLDRYIVNQGIANNTTEISTSRSALRRELMSPTMTWKVFNKGLLFLRIETVTLSMTLFRDNSKTTTHEYTYRLSDESKASEDEPNVLSKFLTNIRMELNISKEEIQELLVAYVKFSKPGASQSEQYAAKCSIQREIDKNNISWKVFVKGLIFLRTYKVIFQLHLLHRNQLISHHSKTLLFR